MKEAKKLSYFFTITPHNIMQRISPSSLFFRVCRLRYALFLLFFLAISAQLSAARPLFSRGRSVYSIVLSPDASVSEQTAARELQQYLQEMSGATLPISRDLTTAGPCIYVGYNAKVEALTHTPQPATNDETFTYRTIGQHLCIYGGRERGTMYGVFAFLEQQLGVHWYTPTFTKVPQRRTFLLPALNHTESPALKIRQLYYHEAMENPVWCAHNRVNSIHSSVQNEYGGMYSYGGIHTFEILMPPHEFFATHPEFFSLYDGRRIADGQLCLSNPAVLRTMIARLRTYIDEHPGHWVYSVSQNDNEKPCQCANCRALEQRYGGHSGLMVWFVNQVAAAVEQTHPGTLVSTFAYQYTRHAPTGIRPRHNVVIRLCDIECCLAHPIASDAQNAAFLKDLRDWSRIAPRLYIWDYVVNFSNYLLPFPNFSVLASNLRTFRDNRCIGVMEEGQYQSDESEFSELRAWLLAQLMWNPEQDTDRLIRHFIADYYGAAAPYIQQYFSACQELVGPKVHFQCRIYADDAIYTDRFRLRAAQLLEQAHRAVAADTLLSRRVDNVRLQMLYLNYARSGNLQNPPAELLRILRRSRTHIAEPLSAEKFLEGKR